MIELDDVCCAFAHEPVLRHVSCQIRKGETVLLTGPNGSGKTTLLRLLNGLVFSELGHYRFEGMEITAARMREHRYAKWFHQRLGYVWQNPDAQLFCASVEEELAFGPLQMGLADDDVRERVEDAIACFSLAPLRKRPPYHLSGGEKKRVALASIFTMNPAAWTLDEPENFLDAKGQEQLVAFLRALKAAGKTIIMTSHHPDIIRSLADRELRLSSDHSLVPSGAVQV